MEHICDRGHIHVGAPQSRSGEAAFSAFVTSSFLLLVVRPGAPSSVLAPTSDALCY